ncbi:hypothetical protein P7K49_005689 [Saguinus oedipus]|uniref:Uncharacterized protein n=1 Tax=Saguinus oedipus TaxID=9490 RepID=A0ABQ9W0B5_SAGOE|nr:hypothetical protein P7K49_005689 [Saguinus oedipus]
MPIQSLRLLETPRLTNAHPSWKDARIQGDPGETPPSPLSAPLSFPSLDSGSTDQAASWTLGRSPTRTEPPPKVKLRQTGGDGALRRSFGSAPGRGGPAWRRAGPSLVGSAVAGDPRKAAAVTASAAGTEPRTPRRPQARKKPRTRPEKCPRDLRKLFEWRPAQRHSRPASPAVSALPTPGLTLRERGHERETRVSARRTVLGGGASSPAPPPPQCSTHPAGRATSRGQRPPRAGKGGGGWVESAGRAPRPPRPVPRPPALVHPAHSTPFNPHASPTLPPASAPTPPPAPTSALRAASRRCLSPRPKRAGAAGDSAGRAGQVPGFMRRSG